MENDSHGNLSLQMSVCTNISNRVSLVEETKGTSAHDLVGDLQGKPIARGNATSRRKKLHKLHFHASYVTAGKRPLDFAAKETRHKFTTSA